MNKQKICIIGGSLTGLVTAISLSKFNCEIDIITTNNDLNSKSNRTIAISENNFNFLNQLNISKSLIKQVWNCSKIKLYTENKNKKISEIFDLNKKKNIFYMIKNSEIIKLMTNKIKKTKNISVKKNTIVTSIFTSGSLKCIKFNNQTSKYNLVIICTGYKSKIITEKFYNNIIENSYNELGITSIIEHGKIKNNIARQIFLDKSIFALLPLSNKKTSIVWSVQKNNKKINDKFLKNEIKYYASNFLKKIKFLNNIEYKNLNFIVRSKYYIDRVLLFGDALHVMHPFIGQGFNLSLRDLQSLEKIINKRIDLGLDIGASDVLSEFTNNVKPRNFMFTIGSDVLKSSLSFKKARNDLFKILNKSSLVKNIALNIADKGFRF